MATRLGSALALAVAAGVAGALQAGAVAADPLPCPPPGGDPAYAVSLLGLTGPAGADLQLDVAPTPQSGCPRPGALKKVQVKVYSLDGTLVSTQNLTDLSAPDGSADIPLRAVGRRQKVATDLLVQDETATKTYVLRGTTHVRLRPDLVVSSVQASRVVFASRTFEVGAQVAELNGDIGASATATLRDGSQVLGTTPVTVDAGGSADVTFPSVSLTDPGRTDLTVSVDGASPGETDVSNNERQATVDVINVADESGKIQVPLGGYGAQMNQNVYAPITGAPPGALGDLESKVVAQKPGLVRVFFNDVQDRTLPGARDSFLNTLRLAQLARATIDVTLQSTHDLNVGPATTRLANVLNTAVKAGISNLRWVTIQNEPNSTGLAPADLKQWYVDLDTKLRTLGLRDQIHFMGLDLVAENQRTWFDFAATNMNTLLDAYSIHVFWNYWDTAKLEQRLEDVRAIVDSEPEAARKPIYSMEYGVRGIRTIGTTNFIDPGVWDQTQQIPLTQTNVNAFQQAWFDILAAQLGYAGTVKWDSYYGKYDNSSQAYFMLGHWDESGLWPVNPIYNVVRFLTAITRPGWSVTSVEQDSLVDTRLAASYAGPNGQLTVVGLDRAGGQLNGLSPTLVPYAIGGLPPSTTFHLVEWNRDGDGRNVDVGPVTTDDAGVARFDVPLNAVFGLTTLAPEL